MKFMGNRREGHQLGTDKSEIIDERQEQTVDHDFWHARWMLRMKLSLQF